MADVMMQAPDGQQYTVDDSEAGEAQANGWKLVQPQRPAPSAAQAPARRASTLDERVVSYLNNLVGSETLADAAVGTSSLYGALDPAVAALGAVGSYLVPHTAKPGASFSERYSNELENLRRTRGESFSRSPTAAMSGAVVPAMTGALPTPVSSAVTQAPGLVPAMARAGAGAADAAIFTGLTNAGMNADQGYLDKLIEGATSKYNLIGAAPGLLEIGKMGVQKFPGIAKMDPAASRLEALGVEPTNFQSLGRHSKMNKVEQTATSLPLTGSTTAANRAAPLEQVESVAYKLGTPPGEAIPSARGPEGVLALREAHNRGYESFGGWPMAPFNGHPGAPKSVPLENAFARIARNTEAGTVDPAVRANASNWLQRQIKGLKADKSGMVDSGQLLSLRQKIREEIHANEKLATNSSEARSYAAIYENAEAAVTRGLSEQLPESEVARLAAHDGAYANFTIIRKAQSLANSALATVGEGPTMANWLRSANAGLSEGSKATPPTNPMQQLIRDSAEVLPNLQPNTGERGVSIGAPLAAAGAAVGGAIAGVPGAAIGTFAGPFLGGASINFAATSPTMRAIMFGGKGAPVAPMSLATQPGLKGLFGIQSRLPAPGYQTPALRSPPSQLFPLFAENDEEIRNALATGGKQKAAAAMYGEQQRDPQRFAQIRQAVK